MASIAGVASNGVSFTVTGSSSSVYYYIEDMLGSSRTIVQDGATAPCYDVDFYPFGGERVIANACPQNYKFEGKERDAETGNDDFGARYYSSRFGRWLSADWSAVPAPVPYANLTNPQTLNLYPMVSDNPETFADLDGHNWWNKLKNLLGEASCWCEGEKAVEAAAANRKKEEEAARKKAEFDNSPEGRAFAAYMATFAGGMMAGISEGGMEGGEGGSDEESPDVNWDAQEKHFEGHNSYQPGRSTLTANPEELVEKAGTGTPVNDVPRGQPGFKERVDFGKVIGKYVDPKSGTSTPTTKGILVYSNKGIHVFPARP